MDKYGHYILRTPRPPRQHQKLYFKIRVFSLTNSNSCLSHIANFILITFISNQLNRLQETFNRKSTNIETIQSLPNGKIICSDYSSCIKELIIENDSWHLIPYAECPNKTITYIKSDSYHNLYVSLDEVSIAFYKFFSKTRTHSPFKTFNLTGGVYDVCTLSDSTTLISNSKGLHIYNLSTNKAHTITDKNKLLLQTIYSIHIDSLGHYWLSSNSGILKYNPKNNLCHQFVEKDGVQGMEFNSHASLELTNGQLILGGTNGMNIFHPDSVHLSTYQTPIRLTDILVNDEEYNFEMNKSHINNWTFDYSQNTLTFKFHGIDYTDPKSVELRYKLSPYEDTWAIFKENKGFC